MNAKAVALLAGGLVAVAGVGTAVGDLGSADERERQLSEFEIRKDDSADDVELVDEEEDDRGGPGDESHDRGGAKDASRGDDRASRVQDPNTGSGDQTGGTQQSWGTGMSGDTGQWQDGTAGDDGTDGGDNSYVAPAADEYVAPAPAPAPAYYGDDGGSDDGGSDG